MFWSISLLLFSACAKTSPSLETNAYYRYEHSLGQYTAEIELSQKDQESGQILAYQPDAGVSFIGSAIDADIAQADVARFKGERRVAALQKPYFLFKGPDGKEWRIEGTLAPIDSFTLENQPTHTFGFTVFSPLPNDTLGPNESLMALFEPVEGQAKLATLQGPTATKGVFKFPRETIGDWPLSRGRLTFIRNKITPIEQEGLKGNLTEEVYTRPFEMGVYN